MFVSRWTVDYGEGPHPAAVPHAWNQDVSVEWEGPAVYRTEVEVPRGGGTLRFWGVSYAAEVLANGVEVARHEGIWDAFDVPLPGGKVELEVRVVKNGGPTHPIETVASGGLPYLFQTFGGIYREVELLDSPTPLVLPPPSTLEPVPYLRAVVHRGWYPDLGHPNPDEHTIIKEVREIKALGFNAVKFAGWVPSHRYLDILQAERMIGWLELPLGQSGVALDRLDSLGTEIERIVLQYRHHPSLAVWTVCGEFGRYSIPSPSLEGLTDMVRALTGGAWVANGPLVGIPSQEFVPGGTFDELHVLDESARSLDALQPGPYPARPILLGEYGAETCHRDLARLGDELPYWASALPELNTNPELPRLLDESPFALEPTRSGHKTLLASSRNQRTYRLKAAVEKVRARAGWIQGYAIEELRDTPVWPSGLFDDWGQARLSPEECTRWNGPTCIYLLPRRRFTESGFGRIDPFNHFAGDVRLDLGLHADLPLEGALWWRIVNESGRTVARGAGAERFVDGAHEVGTVAWEEAVPGAYRLEAGFGPAENAWDLWVVERETIEEEGERVPTYGSPTEASQGILVLRRGDEGVFESSAYHDLQFLDDAFWAGLPLRDRWSRLDSLERGNTLAPAWLRERFGGYETLLNGVNSLRVEADHPILVRAGNWFVTTLDPRAPDGLSPAGVALLRSLWNALYPSG